MNDDAKGIVYLAILIIWGLFSFISKMTKKSKEKRPLDIPEQFRDNQSKDLPEKNEFSFDPQPKEAIKTSPAERKAAAKESKVEEKIYDFKKKKRINFFNKIVKKKSPLATAMIFHEILEPPLSQRKL